MAEIIFDALDPNMACLEAPPKTPQSPDKCQVEATFHIHGDITPPNPTVAFRRSRDKFILESTADRDATIALLRGYGFSDSNDRLQSALFYSVELNRFVRNTHTSFVAMHNYQGPSLLPLGGKIRNFFVTGSIQETDPKQTAEAEILLKEILKKPQEARDYFNIILESLNADQDNKAVFHPSIRPRIQWLGDFLKTFETFQESLSKIRDEIQQEAFREKLISLVIFLATGNGDYPTLRKEFKFFAQKFRQEGDFPEELKNLGSHMTRKLRSIERIPTLNSSAPILQRLRQILLDLSLMESPQPLVEKKTSKDSKNNKLKIALPITLGLSTALGLGLGLGLEFGLRRPMPAPEDRNPTIGLGP